MAFLKVFSNGEERTVFLGEDPVVCGRGDDVDLLLKDPKASRRHCVVEPCGGGRWRVRDLDSGNGTRVNGDRVGEHELDADDVIKVGDAKILFAGEAAAVVGDEPASEERARPARARRARQSSNPTWVVAGLLLLGLVVLFVVYRSLDRGEAADPEIASAYKAVLAARSDHETVRLADAFLAQYPDVDEAATIRAKADEARQRMRDGTPLRRDGWDPRSELTGLSTREQVARLETMLDEVAADRRTAVRRALQETRDALRDEREAFFGDLEEVFRGYVADGEFARAREIWFFLAGQEDWQPLPPPFPQRIVDNNRDLENAASAARTRLFEEIGRHEAAHDFQTARKRLLASMPRFKGTSVMRALEERRTFLDQAIAHGVEGKPTRAPTLVPLEIEKRVNELLARLRKREFGPVAAGLKELAFEAKKAKSSGVAELELRAREVEAAARLHRALVGGLKANQLPKGNVAKRYKVLAGDAEGITVRTRGKELRYAWREVPFEVYLGMLGPIAGKVKDGVLGYVVVAHAVGDEEAFAAALHAMHAKNAQRAEVDRFVAVRVRNEPVPPGGYVVHEGKIYTKREHLRLVEEALIKELQGRFDRAYTTIKGDTSFSKLKKLQAKKDKLDEARAYADELIFDEKKYFYPYRGTGRMGEYTKVQQEVDRRVAGVREIWDDRSSVKVKASKELQKALKEFDETAVELEKRLVDVEEKVDEVAFLRAYFGKKFTIRNVFRDRDEYELLRYSEEVMEYNTGVQGDITDVEREQVRITNEYRMMFGRWPVRLHPKLVLSSRDHCAEMAKLGYFGHFSPTPGRRTPFDRMKLAGYDYGSSENCIMGRTHPQAAHDGWCHSSGHHRNILMRPWTEMGTGHYGRLMTQNYGQAPKYSKHDEPEDEESGGAGREWEDWDEDGGAEKEDDGFDYGDDDEG